MGSLLSAEFSRLREKLRTAAIAYVAAFVLAMLGLVSLLLAALGAIARKVDPILGASALGVGLLLVAALVLWASRISQRRKHREPVPIDLGSVAVPAGMALLSLAARRGGIGTFLAVATGAAAYAIYRENRARVPLPGMEFK